MRRRDQALMSRQDAPVIRDLEDQIESMKANIDYIQEGIAESQTNIMQIEDSKVCVEFFFMLIFSGFHLTEHWICKGILLKVERIPRRWK